MSPNSENIASLFGESEERYHKGQSTHADAERVSQHSRDDAVASARVLIEDYTAVRSILHLECSGTFSY